MPLNVKPTGKPVPMERSRVRIEKESVVPDTMYYRRRIAKGELEIVREPLRVVKAQPKAQAQPQQAKASQQAEPQQARQAEPAQAKTTPAPDSAV